MSTCRTSWAAIASLSLWLGSIVGCHFDFKGKPSDNDSSGATLDRSNGVGINSREQCLDQGRVFAPGRLPSSDGCNQCQCSCTSQNKETRCTIGCTQQGCLPAPKLPQLDVGLVYDQAGSEAIYRGIRCAEQKLCNADLDYTEACQRYGGVAVDNGCCEYACTVKVIREPAGQAPDPVACEAAKKQFSLLIAELTTVVQDQGGQRYTTPRAHNCQTAADCVVVALSGDNCSSQTAFSLAAYQPLAANLAAQANSIKTACPQFYGDCPLDQTLVQPDCVSEICTIK